MIKKSLFVFLLVFSTLLFISHQGQSSILRDSIGLEKKGSKNFILHKVDPKETLYSISRKYNVSVGQVQQANAEIKSGISIGQIIKIPYAPPSIKSAVLGSRTHIVAPKETLFSISKKYKISIEELKRANAGLAMGLKKGQELIIPSKAAPKTIKEKDSNEQTVSRKTENKEPVKEITKEEPKITKPAKEEEEVKPKKESDVSTKSLAISSPPTTVASSYKKINESGFASLMEDNPTDLKYLALHKTAPVGTIVQVRNDDNNQKIFVRVSGKLNTGTDKVILKVSPKAFERLGAKGEKIPISISYIP